MIEEVALYVRVSSDEQDIAGQERELREYVARRGWRVGAVYAEKTSATGKTAREQHSRLLSDAKNPRRRWRRVVVWALDRWSRDPSFARAVLSIEELEQLGIRFHSFKEPGLDSGEDSEANLGRDLLRGILPTIAAFESRRKSERVQLSMDEIKSGRRKTRSGKPPGRPRRVTPEKEARIRELRKQGLRWKEISVRVGLPEGTVRTFRESSPALKTPRVEIGAPEFPTSRGGNSPYPPA